MVTFADSVISFSVVTFSGSVVTFACGEDAQDEEGLSSEDFFSGREPTTLSLSRGSDHEFLVGFLVVLITRWGEARQVRLHFCHERGVGVPTRQRHNMALAVPTRKWSQFKTLVVHCFVHCFNAWDGLLM